MFQNAETGISSNMSLAECMTVRKCCMKALQEQGACPEGSTEAWPQLWGWASTPQAVCSAFPHVFSWLVSEKDLPELDVLSQDHALQSGLMAETRFLLVPCIF